MGAVRALAEDGLFIGQPPAFFRLLKELASAADTARPNRPSGKPAYVRSS